MIVDGIAHAPVATDGSHGLAMRRAIMRIDPDGGERVIDLQIAHGPDLLSAAHDLDVSPDLFVAIYAEEMCALGYIVCPILMTH